MNLRLFRYDQTPVCTRGLLFLESTFQCHTLEDPMRPVGEKIAGRTAIPTGTYLIRLRVGTPMGDRYVERYGALFSHGMLHLQDVPFFTWIYLHIGNKPADTSGCILVGNTSDATLPWIGQSEPAYRALYTALLPALRTEEPVTLVVEAPATVRSAWDVLRDWTGKGRG